MLRHRSIGGEALATHKSAQERARQALRRRARNRQVRSRVRSAVKEAREAVESGKPEGIVEALRSAEGLLRRAASKGVIPKKRASRQVSRLARAGLKDAASN
jgi:small subunit ribosomal protein S20